MKFYDLFSGIGGFHLALSNAGHNCVGACEIDKYAKQIYESHFEVNIDNDARQINPFKLPDFNILCAGFPCQAFSIAGKRRGFAETRGTVFFEIARIASIKKPRYLLLENVKGLLNHEKGKTFETILNILQELGYNVEWQTINTKHYLPQNRERVFIVGHLAETSTRKIFPIGQGSKITNSSQGTPQTKGQRVRHGYTRALDANYYKGGSHGSLIQVGYINSNSQGQRVYDTDGYSATITSQGGGWGAKTGLYEVKDKTGIYMTSHTKANIKQRYQIRDTTWTIDTSGSKMAVEDKKRIRRLTPLEYERLQGFPDDWTYGISDTQRYKCLGNAVSVPVVYDIARRIR